MLAAAMDALLSPLFVPARIKFVPLRAALPVGLPAMPPDVLFPMEAGAAALNPAGKAPPLQELADGALYVLCYKPLHRDANPFRQVARYYVHTHAPEFCSTLLLEARQAMLDGDWVGTVARLWTVIQVEPPVPERLDELAQACFFFGFKVARRGEIELAARLARAAAAALNHLLDSFPDYGPAQLRKAEFLASAGDGPGAESALHEAVRLGVPLDEVQDAFALIREGGLSGGEKPGI